MKNLNFSFKCFIKILSGLLLYFALTACSKSVSVADVPTPAPIEPHTDSDMPKDLERLITGIKALGYKFINLEDYVASTNIKKANRKVEIEDLK